MCVYGNFFFGVLLGGKPTREFSPPQQGPICATFAPLSPDRDVAALQLAPGEGRHVVDAVHRGGKLASGRVEEAAAGLH